MDVKQQVAFWHASSLEDPAAAESLLSKHKRHALFLAHLALEKMLKAHVTRAAARVPPRIHDLLRLAELGGIALTPDQQKFLARFQQYCLGGRYPDMQRGELDPSVAAADFAAARELHAWLLSLLS